MTKPFKCEYCEARPTTTHEKEFLCNRHYLALYGKPILTQQLDGVPQTPKEKELKEHYMLILANHNFVDARKTKKIVKQFLADVRTIKIHNTIYH
jgi:hypothetical protein